MEVYTQRKFPRRPFQRAIGVLSAGNYFLLQGVEIGEGGISMVCPEPYEENTILVLSFQIPNGDFVSTTVQVRSSQDNSDGTFTLGCVFQNIKFENKRQIRTYVSARVQ